jgi:hypothetical protein
MNRTALPLVRVFCSDFPAMTKWEYCQVQFSPEMEEPLGIGNWHNEMGEKGEDG